MSDIWSQLAMYFEYSFVVNAFIVGVLISLCSSMLGVSLVLKRLSFIGDSLAHTVFGIMSLGAIVGFLDNMLVVLAITIAITVAVTRTGASKLIQGDAILTLMSVSSLGVGYLVMNMSNSSANLAADVCSTLFGSTSILTLTKSEVNLCIALTVIVVCVYVFFYNKLFAVTFDEDFARATGVNVELYNTIISIILAIIIVLAINLVGSLLISALIVFPALSSMRVFNSFRSVIISSAVLSVLCSSVGLVLSVLYGTPVGSTIVAVDLVAFCIFCFIGKIRR